MDDELWGRQSAFDEARVLYGMVLHGEESVQELRELIAVPPKIESVLRAYARAHPEEEPFIDRSLKFRVAVLEAFEALVRDGVTDAAQQETESDSFEDALSLPCQNSIGECSALG